MSAFAYGGGTYVNGIYTPICVPFVAINTTGFVDP